MTLRKQDNQSEAAVAAYLDRHFYPKYVTNFQRFDDLAHQLKGIDVQFEYQERTCIVDEKAAAHYVNKNLPTFAFELNFIGRDQRLHTGWLYDDKKETEYYLLSWIWAKKEKGFTADDITKLEIMLVSRKRITFSLAHHGLTKERAFDISKALRAKKQFGVSEKTQKPFYLYYTKHLVEQPINVIIRKQALKKISVLHLLL